MDKSAASHLAEHERRFPTSSGDAMPAGPDYWPVPPQPTARRKERERLERTERPSTPRESARPPR